MFLPRFTQIVSQVIFSYRLYGKVIDLVYSLCKLFCSNTLFVFFSFLFTQFELDKVTFILEVFELARRHDQ